MTIADRGTAITRETECEREQKIKKKRHTQTQKQKYTDRWKLRERKRVSEQTGGYTIKVYYCISIYCILYSVQYNIMQGKIKTGRI